MEKISMRPILNDYSPPSLEMQHSNRPLVALNTAKPSPLPMSRPPNGIAIQQGNCLGPF